MTPGELRLGALVAEFGIEPTDLDRKGKRKYAKWAGKKDEKEEKKAFKAKERKAHKAAVKKIVSDEKAARRTTRSKADGI